MCMAELMACRGNCLHARTDIARMTCSNRIQGPRTLSKDQARSTKLQCGEKRDGTISCIGNQQGSCEASFSRVWDPAVLEDLQGYQRWEMELSSLSCESPIYLTAPIVWYLGSGMEPTRPNIPDDRYGPVELAFPSGIRMQARVSGRR